MPGNEDSLHKENEYEHFRSRNDDSSLDSDFLFHHSFLFESFEETSRKRPEHIAVRSRGVSEGNPHVVMGD